MNTGTEADPPAEFRDLERNRVFVTMNATFKDEAKCRAAMETIVNDAHAAYGVTSHFWCRSEDGTSLFVVEQYADQSALRQAIRRFTFARLAFFRSIKVAEVAVHGDVSFAIKVSFSLLRPKYMNYFGGYSKSVAPATEAGIKDVERDRIFIASQATGGDEPKTRASMESLVMHSYAQSGISTHFWTRSKNRKTLSVLHQYLDEQALTDHLLSCATPTDAFPEVAGVRDVTIYGVQSDEVKQMLAPLNATYMDYYGGYSK